MGVVDIRAALPEDASGIAIVHVRSWQSAYRGLLPQAYLDRLDPAQRATRWEQHLAETDWSRAGILIADAGGRLLGFVSYGPARDDDADPQRIGQIYSIYLTSDAWGQGTGRQLMAAALERLAEAGFCQATLWVLDSNARARRFYEAGGWAADGSVMQDDSRGFPLIEVRYRRGLP
jgi:ribosomal protein S18 acetylase RimI-like enzyme